MARRKSERLSEADVETMRRLRRDAGMTFKQLAERFGVCERSVRQKLGKAERGERRDAHPAHAL
jgi:transcriptional regulator with XRE-family HTH domain